MIRHRFVSPDQILARVNDLPGDDERRRRIRTWLDAEVRAPNS